MAASAPIAAIATGSGPAGVGILRLSGAGSLEVARRRLAGLPAHPEPRRLVRAALLDEAGAPLDDVLAVHFPAPHSYTGEEVVEIQAHGGGALLRAGLRALVAAGASPAAPGEFTRRAVQNGRMDLLDAEALAALLSADEDEALCLARRAQRETAPALRRLRSEALAALAEALGSQDHPLEVQGEPLTWEARCLALAARCGALALGAAPDARELFGPRLLLLGPANAGKSSLLNALVGEERALVDAAPGTTRDLVEAPVRLAGRRATLCDSAGIREAAGVEAAGVERALAAARVAECVVWVEDLSLPPAAPPPGVQIGLSVLSKADLPPHPSRIPIGGQPASEPGLSKADLAPHPSRPSGTALRVSVWTGEGLPALRLALEDRVRRALPAGEATLRQRPLLLAAEEGLRAAGQRGPEDLRVARLEAAVATLGRLSGEGPGGEEAAALVFQRFCLGK